MTNVPRTKSDAITAAIGHASASQRANVDAAAMATAQPAGGGATGQPQGTGGPQSPGQAG